MPRIFSEEVRYPESGDKFFIESGNSDEIAWLNKAFQKFGNYADCYQTGALCLIDSALKDERLRDYNIYPTVFLIRHYLELRLKELIQGLNFCIKQERDFPKHHKIELLWNEFKKAYSEIGENSDDDRFKVISELINELTLVDPISMSFRYPVDRNGQPTQKLEYINLVNLKESFIRVSFVFDAVASQIGHYVEITEEMLGYVYYDYWE